MGVSVGLTSRDVVSEYRPNPIQKAFHESPAQIRGLFGGSALGKSRAIGQEALFLALEYPRNLVTIARDVLADLRSTTKVTFLQEVMPPELLSCRDVEWRESELKLVIHANGSEIQFIGLDKPGRLGSMNCGSFIIDEAHLLEDPEKWFFAFRRQMRRPNVRHCGVFAGHPLGKTSWFYHKFFVQKPPGWEMFTGGPMDNKENLPDGFIDDLERDYASDPRYLRRYVYGDWEDFEGQVFSEFDLDRHTCEPFEIPRHWTRLRGMDYGLAQPTTCEWAAIDDQGRIWFYDEAVMTNMAIPQQVMVINTRSFGDEISMTLLDGRSAGLRQQTESGLITVRHQYLQHGLPVVPSATGRAADVEAGILMMKGLLASDRLRIMRPGTIKNRSFGCPKLIREMMGLVYAAPRDGGILNDKFRGDDHCLDAARYITSRHYANAVIERGGPKPGSLEDMLLAENARLQHMSGTSELYD